MATTLSTGESATARPHRAAWAFAATAIYFGLVLGVLRVRFETNDDEAMRAVASGVLTGAPCEFLIFQNNAWGLLLRGLYRAAPGWDWYSSGLLVLHFSALWALLTLLLGAHSPGRRVFLASLLLLVFETRFLLLLQFTTTACLAALAGLALLASALRPQGSNGSAAFGVLLCVAAYLVRGQAFWMTAAVAAPIVLCLSVGILRPGNRPRAVLWAAGSGLAIAGGAAFHSAWYARHPEYEPYLAFNYTRSMLHDFPPARQLAADTELPAGWTDNDRWLFLRWWLLDEDLFSRERLQQYLDRLPRDAWRHSLEDAGLALAHGGARRGLLLVLCGCGLAMCLAWESPSRFLALQAAGLIAAGLLLYLAMVARTPPRIVHALLAIPALGACLLLAERSPAAAARMLPGRRLGNGLGLACLAAGLAWGCIETGTIHFENRQRQRFLERSLDKIQNGMPADARLVLSDPKDWPPDVSGPFRRSAYDLERPFLVGGWLSQSPASRAQRERLGVRDPIAALREGDGVYLFASQPFAEQVAAYLGQHHGLARRPVAVREYPFLGDDHVGFYRLEPIPRP